MRVDRALEHHFLQVGREHAQDQKEIGVAGRGRDEASLAAIGPVISIASGSGAVMKVDTRAEQQALESIGYKFIYSDYNIEPTQSDFSSDAQAMKSDGAQGLFFLAIGSLYAEVARAVQDAGLHLIFPDYSENAYDPTFLADAGSAANGAILKSFLAMYGGEDSTINPMVALLNKWYRALYGSPPDEFAAWGWMVFVHYPIHRRLHYLELQQHD